LPDPDNRQRNPQCHRCHGPASLVFPLVRSEPMPLLSSSRKPPPVYLFPHLGNPARHRCPYRSCATPGPPNGSPMHYCPAFHVPLVSNPHDGCVYQDRKTHLLTG